MSSVELIAGCMTGTSLDGLDAALVRVSGTDLSMRAEVVRAISRPLGRLARPLRRLAEQHPMTAGEVAVLSRDFALLHVKTLRELLGRERPALVSVHGQTVFHAPPVSWQLMNPAPIVEALDVPVVFDLRAADLARGGEGAPITPLADFVFFRSETRTRMVVNLGGFCNVTLLPRVAACLRERGLDDVLIFAGGIIPDEDVQPLKDAGIAAVFGPGTNTDHVVEFIRGQFQTA